MSSELPEKRVVERVKVPPRWLWDKYPLAPDSWDNIQVCYDGDDRQPLIRKLIDGRPEMLVPDPIYEPFYELADGPVSPFFINKGMRQCYLPTEADIERVRRLFPEHPYPEAPPWSEVATRLILAGHKQPDPAGIRAPALLALLEQIEAASSTPARRRTTTKTKRNTELDGAKLKLIAALTKHHRGANGKIVNQEPLKCDQLAELAGVKSKGTASKFLKEKFGSHRKYKKACEDYQKLATALKSLNGEYTPFALESRIPPEQVADDDDDE